MKPVDSKFSTRTPGEVSERDLDDYISENYKTMHDWVETYVNFLVETGQRAPSTHLYDLLYSTLEELIDELGIRHKVRAIMRDLMKDEQGVVKTS
jgi:hypothetical protein